MIWVEDIAAVSVVLAVVCCLPLYAALGRLREVLASPGRPWRAAFAEAAFAVLGTAAFAGLLLASAMQMAGGTYSPFIYFRF